VGMASETVKDFLFEIKSKNLQNKMGENISSEFLQDIENLESSYQELIKILEQELYDLEKPTTSEKVNSTLAKFVETTVKLRNDTKKVYSRTDATIEQGLTKELAVKFIQELLSN